MKLLVTIGALNWGLVGIGGLFGLGNWNIVHMILGGVMWLEYVIYILVGLSALMLTKACGGKCNKGGTCSLEEAKPAMDMGNPNHSDSDHHQM
ncbi:MAG: uncharacterized membrane protein YuzA (DUF378 family) [Candidatus Paceibacteria bacterium]|jgi:uncharacterized membrane protein YuzA (DUF378 family)